MFPPPGSQASLDATGRAPPGWPPGVVIRLNTGNKMLRLHTIHRPPRARPNSVLVSLSSGSPGGTPGGEHCRNSQATNLHSEMGTAVNRGPRGADGRHLYDTAASFSPLSPTLLLPHWPYCHTCPAHTGPRAFALSAGVSAWNERSSSSCGTAGQVLLSRSQLKCQLLPEASPDHLGPLVPLPAPPDPCPSKVSCCLISLTAPDSETGTHVCLSHVFICQCLLHQSQASPAGSQLHPWCLAQRLAHSRRTDNVNRDE